MYAENVRIFLRTVVTKNYKHGFVTTNDGNHSFGSLVDLASTTKSSNLISLTAHDDPIQTTKMKSISKCNIILFFILLRRSKYLMEV